MKKENNSFNFPNLLSNSKFRQDVFNSKIHQWNGIYRWESKSNVSGSAALNNVLINFESCWESQILLHAPGKTFGKSDAHLFCDLENTQVMLEDNLHKFCPSRVYQSDRREPKKDKN